MGSFREITDIIASLLAEELLPALALLDSLSGIAFRSNKIKIDWTETVI
ncbi:MAG: hypothetical protein CM1200mP10_24700 [Candidatus Neomarinimicrobiota bacterium]|nr:MAG: hypothetical protein CM1200mP10_24700 [Candidatus Neomarinimicrobiota bacterium]